MKWFKKKSDEEIVHNNMLDNIYEESLSIQGKEKAQKSKEEKLKLLEIASNCAISGEPSSRTIERAVAFKKYLLS